MCTGPAFVKAFPYQADVFTLPVKDINAAVAWYSAHFGMNEVERRDQPRPAVILQRDSVRLGFETNGRDPSQDGAAILVTDISSIRQELESNGVPTANWGVDEREGQKLQVFFVVAPDGLCFYFHEPIGADGS